MRVFLLAIGMALAAPANAEVVSADAHGFEVQQSVQLVVPAARAYSVFGQVGGWWNDDHTYSGKGANMRLSLQPGGCFCEQIPAGGGVEHMRVAVVQPNERIVMTGSLGPLLYEAATGVMDIKFERIAGGSRVTMSYRAAGFAKGGADRLAPIVDKVLGEQMKRYRALAGTPAKRT
jgi:uncharacterized protein YndB with AHSA1/START domain